MALTGPSTQKAHMSTQHHEALRLAKTTPSLRGGDWGDRAAAELRRLHALNAGLLEALGDCLDDLRHLASARDSDYARPDQQTIDKARVAIAKAEGREA